MNRPAQVARRGIYPQVGPRRLGTLRPKPRRDCGARLDSSPASVPEVFHYSSGKRHSIYDSFNAIVERKKQSALPTQHYESLNKSNETKLTQSRVFFQTPQTHFDMGRLSSSIG